MRQLAEKQHTARMNSIIRAVLCGNVCLLLSHIRLTALPMLISGYDGGTGAAPLNAIKHAGTPWEIGLTRFRWRP